MMKKLFICYTPLHTIIARRVIETERLTECTLVYICFQSSNKHEKYFNDLAALCNESYFLQLKHSLISDLLHLTKLSRTLWSTNHICVLYTGNIKHFHSRFLCLLLGIKNFYTFDDGSGNISGGGYLYDDEENKLTLAFFSLFSHRLLYKNIKKNITNHFTIYEHKNVYTPSKFIPLITDIKAANNNDNKTLNIYLSNAFSEDSLMSVEEECAMDQRIISKFKIDTVLPHPRSKKSNPFLDTTADCELIAEDYILKKISEGYDVSVYACYSTVLLNLSSIARLKLFNIDIPINKPLSELRKLLKNMGVIEVILS